MFPLTWIITHEDECSREIKSYTTLCLRDYELENDNAYEICHTYLAPSVKIETTTIELVQKDDTFIYLHVYEFSVDQD